MTSSILGLTLAILVGGCGADAPEPPETGQPVTQSLTADQVRDIAREAYLYGFPMVMNYKTMYQCAIGEDSPEYKGAFNEVSCEARLFTPADEAVVTPNEEYGSNWLPAPDGPFYLVMRLYGPMESALEGRWMPPPVRKAKDRVAGRPAPRVAE